MDLSVGSVVGLSAFACGRFVAGTDHGVLTVLLLGATVGVVCGLVSGALVSFGGVPALVVTLGMLYVVQGVDYWWAQGDQINAAEVPDPVLGLGSGSVSVIGVPYLPLIAVVLLAATAYFLRNHRSGRELYAIGSSPEAALLAGIPIRRRILAAYVFSGAVAGFAGALWLARFGTVVAGQVDLSVASMLGLGSALTGALWNAGWAFETIVPVVLLAGAAGGLLNGWLVTRVGLPSLAVTIGTLALYRGLASVVLGSDAVTDFPQAYADWTVDTTTVPGTFVTYPVLLFAVLAVVTGIVLHATFAIGSPEEAAYFAGIRVKRIKLLLFVVTGLFAAFAGVLFTLRYGSARADNGLGFEMLVIASVLLGGVDFDGGKGTVFGAVAGVLLIGV
ncbi:ABC transporter permease, partial [Streptomyces mirabilis]